MFEVLWSCVLSPSPHIWASHKIFATFGGEIIPDHLTELEIIEALLVVVFSFLFVGYYERQRLFCALTFKYLNILGMSLLGRVAPVQEI